MSEQDTPTLPNAEKKGRPTKAQLDERTADLDKREADLKAREEEMRGAAFDGTLPDRTSIDEVVREKTDHGQADPKSVRKPLRQGKWLADTTLYEEKYHEQKLLWVNDLQGDVQRWINYGAEPVPVLTRASKTFAGITDKVESKWARSVGGDDGMGGHFWVYLMVVDHEIYDEVKLSPERERQELIRRAMKTGADASDYGAGPKLPSYAPFLPTGGRGYDETHETIAPTQDS